MYCKLIRPLVSTEQQTTAVISAAAADGETLSLLTYFTRIYNSDLWLCLVYAFNHASNTSDSYLFLQKFVTMFFNCMFKKSYLCSINGCLCIRCPMQVRYLNYLVFRLNSVLQMTLRWIAFGSRSCF